MQDLSFMRLLLLAAAGGAIGSGARHLVNIAGGRLLPPTFPWPTLAINIVGSMAMGVVMTLLAQRVGSTAELRTFFATGILGGFTTFSAFSLETVQLYERGSHVEAGLYVVASVVLAIAGLVLGGALVRSVTS
jgi:CrcB protein